MRKFNNPVKDFGYLIYRWVTPFFDPLITISSLSNFPGYFKDMVTYSRMKGAEPIRILNTYPILHEKNADIVLDKHYFYQDIWALKKIFNAKPKTHVDVGSKINFAGFLTGITKVTYIDLHPPKIKLKNFITKNGNILLLPFKSSSISSLSCLNVAEHIGLGRYGDPLDPFGTKKACKELSRILARGGNLYFSVPVGKPRLIFNAHRIHSPNQIINYFKNLRLVELSAVTDQFEFIENISLETLENSSYACGLFHLKKV